MIHQAIHPRCPDSTLELEEAEHLLVWALRRWLAGLQGNSAQQWSMVWNDFAKRFGAEDGRKGLAGLAALVKELQISARRTIHHLPPCCRFLGADELSVLGFVGACQRGDWALARAQAEWLVRADGIGGLLEAGVRLSAVLSAHSLHLPERSLGAPCSVH